MTTTATDHRPRRPTARAGPLLDRSPATRSTRRARTRPLDVLWVLYDRVLRVTPDTVDDPDRDRFLLSKGHGRPPTTRCSPRKGFIPDAWLDDLAGPESRLGHHPDRTPGARGRDRLRLARARPRAGRRHRARPARPGPAPTPGVRAARRRRTGRGLQPRGDRVRRRDRAGPRSPRSSSTTRPPATAGRAASPAGSPSTAGPPHTVDGRDHDALYAAPRSRPAARSPVHAPTRTSPHVRVQPRSPTAPETE